MHLRRTAAAVFAVGTLFAASACAGDNLDNSASDSQSPSTAPSGGTSPSSETSGEPSSPQGSGELHIASQSFPEAAMVADMYQQLLEKDGYDVDVKLVDTRDAYMATFPGTVDVVPEYVGGIVNFLNSAKNGADAKPFEAGDGDQLASDGKSLLDKAGISLLDVSAATDTNAFMVTQDYSDSNGVTKLSDLKGKQVVVAAAPDCEGRLDCAGGLEDKYGIDVTKVLPLGYASDQTYKSVLDGESQLGETSTTDGTLQQQGLVVLDDDMHIQPAQNLVPAVSTKFLQAHPDVADVLNPLMAALTTDKLTQLNAEVSVERKKPEDVATEFLTSAGLL